MARARWAPSDSPAHFQLSQANPQKGGPLNLYPSKARAALIGFQGVLFEPSLSKLPPSGIHNRFPSHFLRLRTSDGTEPRPGLPRSPRGLVGNQNQFA